MACNHEFLLSLSSSSSLALWATLLHATTVLKIESCNFVDIFTVRKRRLGQGNVFSPVSFCSQGGGRPLPLDADPLPGRPLPLDADPFPWMQTPPPGCRPPSDADPPGRHLLDADPLPLDADPLDADLPGRHPPLDADPLDADPQSDTPWMQTPSPPGCRPPPPGCRPPGCRTLRCRPPRCRPPVTSTSGRYASYWNAFLLLIKPTNAYQTVRNSS